MTRPEGRSPLQEFLDACRPLASDLVWRRSVFLAEPDALNVHALRGAARRLGSAIWLFEAALPSRDAAWIRRELKWLARRLGELRDLDVLLERVTDLDHPDDSPATRPQNLLLGVATLAREQSVTQALRALRSARATVLVDGLGTWLFEAAAGLDSKVGASVIAQPALVDLDARVRADGARITCLGSRRRHALRRQIKTLRFAVETLTTFEGCERASAYLPPLLELSHVLGDLNDDAVCVELSERLAPGQGVQAKGRKSRLRPAWAAFEGSAPPF